MEKLTQKEQDKFDDYYNDLWSYLKVKNQNIDIDKPLSTEQIRDYLLKEKGISDNEIKKFILYIKEEGQSVISTKSSSSRDSNSIFISKSSIQSPILPTSTHTLLLNCCHGLLETVTIKNNRLLSHFKNPIQNLNRLIEGAQMCITSHFPMDTVDVMKELKAKNWNTLNSENIIEAKKIVQNIKAYKQIKIKTIDSDLYYAYQARANQLSNTLQYVTNTINEKIINKYWQVSTKKSFKSPSGIYFVNKTIFNVPSMKTPYKQGGFDDHFNYSTNQITYTIFDNILTCPIYKQYNNYLLRINIPEVKSWEYNVHSNTFEYGEMIYQTSAYALYNYLSNIQNVSMIDMSCEVSDNTNKINKLKAQRDSYRKLGPKVGKKLVKKITKKIYREEIKPKSKARGKRITRKIL